MHLYKPLKRAVVGLLHIIGKEAGRQFVILLVILQTLTTIALSGTAAVCAVTMFQIGFIVQTFFLHITSQKPSGPRRARR
jgi:hypothetical protein